MEYESLQEELNIEQKKMFKKWLLETIDNENEFKKVVKLIGKAWSVARSLKGAGTIEEKYENVSSNLWNNRNLILGKKGSKNCYDDWNKPLKDLRVYSYQSKICFLMNPQYYGIIYDSQNTAELKRLNKEKSFTDKAITKENWQGIVSSYYEKQKNITDLNDLNDEEIFKIDYDLWSKGADLLTKENQND